MTSATNSSAPSCADAAAHEAAPSLFLKICRGKTRFPRRAIDAPAFLIGSSPQCQLRLGGAIPPNHSTIFSIDGEAVIEAVADAPSLRVNGVECRRSPVRSGDLIEIGPFALTVDAPLASECSAADLLALIEAEQAIVDEFETGRLRGGEALLNAVRRRAAELAPASDEPAADFLQDLESAVDLLHDFSDEMERRASRLTEREAGFARAGRRLLEAQQRLAAQIDSVQKRINALDVEQPAPLRKVA